jgi:hypothetical protein
MTVFPFYANSAPGDTTLQKLTLEEYFITSTGVGMLLD